MQTVEHAVRRHLSTKNVTLWGDYDLTRPDRFEKAVEWLTSEVEGVLRQNVAVPTFTPQPEKIVTEAGRTITVTRPPLDFGRQPILPMRGHRVTIDPYRVDL